jgi:flagellar hook-associated protein 3 FlgL
MIAGINAYNGSFLASLSDLETRISQVNQQISSGVRVNQASDDPSAVATILEYQGQIGHINQVHTNLNSAQTEAQSADGALQSASTLLDQLVSIGSNGASGTASAATRTSLGQQVQGLAQQLISIANTSVNGRYIFGGDSPVTAPYTYDWTSPEGVVQNSNPTNTATITDASGNQIVPRLTAQQIFDARNPDGTPATGNIFSAVYSLGQALLSNDQTGIQSALDRLKAGVAQLGQATTSYGNIATWIQQASEAATTQLNNVTQALSSIRDSDIATDATQLTLDRTALDAALSAHGTLNTKSLFSYLG